MIVDLAGPVELRVLVSQGCAPIGPEMVVTQRRVERDPRAGRTAGVRAARRDRRQASTRSRRSWRSAGVLAGLVIDENRVDYGPDDYLVRGILGGDPESGAIAVGDVPRVGQTFRFHVRDASTADAGLRAALEDGVADARAGRAAACSSPATAAARACSAVPTTTPPRRPPRSAARPSPACSAPGEIGPVGGPHVPARLHGDARALRRGVARSQISAESRAPGVQGLSPGRREELANHRGQAPCGAWPHGVHRACQLRAGHCGLAPWGRPRPIRQARPWRASRTSVTASGKISRIASRT